MRDLAEVDYHEIQFGIRAPNSEVRPLAIGPAEAERMRDAGYDIVRRDRTVYLPTVSDWREVPARAELHAARARTQGEPDPRPTAEIEETSA